MNRNVFLLFMGLTAMVAAGCSGGGTAPPGSSSGGAGGQGGGGQGGAGGQGGSGGIGGQGGSGGQGGGNALCADRPAGALVTFDIVGQSFTVWITNTAFIDEAKMLKEQGMQRVPMFEQVIDGQDCDPQWTFHVDPEKVSFADFTIELCDGTPQYIEDNTADWLAQVKSYCPWSAKVTNVDVHP